MYFMFQFFYWKKDIENEIKCSRNYSITFDLKQIKIAQSTNLIEQFIPVELPDSRKHVLPFCFQVESERFSWKCEKKFHQK